MNSQDCLLADSKISCRDGSEARRILRLWHRHDLGAILLSRWDLLWSSTIFEKAAIVRENVGSSMSDEVIDVLAIYAFVKNINIVALSLLNLGDRLHQSFVLSDTFSIPNIKR